MVKKQTVSCLENCTYYFFISFFITFLKILANFAVSLRLLAKQDDFFQMVQTTTVRNLLVP